ncbi:MAG: (Fe-S)-binding protein, partial [Pseudomonadota bacterium]
VLRSVKEAKRFDRIGQRIVAVLLNMFGQKKLFFDPIPGLAHALIFWGFCVVSIESINFFLGAFNLPFRLPFTSFVFKGFFELFCLLVLLALGYLFGRRIFFQETRITKSWSGLFILGLILGLIVTGLFLNAGESVLLASPNSWKFISNALFAPLMVGADNERNLLLYNLNWWIHGLIFLFFLNYLLCSKHMHVLTIIFNVFFKKLEPLGQISKLDLENSETFGLGNFKDLHWKDVLDGYTCTECGRCSEVCPAKAAGKHLDPREIILDVRYLANQQEATGKNDKDLLESFNYSKEEDIWDCTSCHACQTVCPVENEHLSKIIGLRQNLVLMAGKIPAGHQLIYKNLENNANPWGMPSAQRGDRARELKIPFLKDNPNAEYVYFMGCASCFDARAKKIVQALVVIFQSAGISFAVLGDEEFCCGETARRTGNEYLFQEMLNKSRETLKRYNIENKKIITSDPHCYNTLKNDFSDFGINLTIVHHTEIILKLILEGKIKLKKGAEKIATYHDSCYLGRYNGITQAPRQILRQMGFQITEMDNVKRSGLCCGAGGGRMWLEEDKEHRLNVNRVKQAIKTKAEFVVTSCPYCVVMLEDGLKTLGNNNAVYDLAELVEAALT